jgi:hypothetical protein
LQTGSRCAVVLARLMLLCSVTLLTVVSPASAKGKHISCQLSGAINDGTKRGNTPIERTLNFYLDDTHATLIGEGGDMSKETNLNVRTTSYSAAKIEAEITTGIISDGMMFFGRVTDGHASLLINRVPGIAALGAKLLPRGSEFEVGPCHEVAPPPAKF